MGYLFSGIELPVTQDLTFIGAWIIWGSLFGTIFLVISFLPKQRKYYSYNAFILLIISLLIIFSGYFLFPPVRAGFTGMVSVSVYTLGGPLWLLIFAWMFHLLSCGELTKDKPGSE